MLRVFRRSPGFAVTAVATLAAGIGAVTGAYSALDALVLRPLPYPHPDRLVAIEEIRADGKPAGVALQNLLDWRARAQRFQAMAAFRPRSFGVTTTGRGPVEVVMTGMVTAGYFPVLGIAPRTGRTFTELEEARDEHLIVLGEKLWSRLLHGEPITNRKLWLNGEPYQVIGVMPSTLEPLGDAEVEAYIPLSRRDYCCGRSGALSAIARIGDGITPQAAAHELDAIARGVAAPLPDIAGRTARIQTLADALRGSRREALWLLIAACSLLTAITVANVSGLLLARLLQRAPELAVRVSLGAGSSRLAWQFLREALELMAPAFLLGLWIAATFLGTLPSLLAWGGVDIAERQWEQATLDWPVIGFGAAVSSAMALILALVPAALARRTNWRGVLTGPAHSAARWRWAAVAAQVALSVVLLASAGLLLRSFRNAASTPAGFEIARAYSFGIGIPEARYDREPKLIRFHQDVLRELESSPSIEAAGFTGRLPLRANAGQGSGFEKEGEPQPPDRRPRASINSATPGYFAAMRIPLLAGRLFDWNLDRPDAPPAILINDTFRRQYFPNEDPLGKRLILPWTSELHPARSLWQIAGVVGDTRNVALDQPPLPEVFLSLTQVGLEGGSYVLRARGDAAGRLLEVVRSTVARVDPDLEQIHLRPLADRLAASLESRRLAQLLTTLCAAIALAVTLLGIAALVSFEAAQRRREIAIRLALGAHTRQLLLTLVARMTGIVGIGLAAGGVLFAMVGRWLRSRLFGVELADPYTLGAVAIFIFATAAAASLTPSLRAAKMNPMQVLREG